jgi:hypothetical protein
MHRILLVTSFLLLAPYLVRGEGEATPRSHSSRPVAEIFASLLVQLRQSTDVEEEASLLPQPNRG